MSNQHVPNPYAPSHLDAEFLPLDESDSKRIPTLGLVAATFVGIVLSGATFGLVLAGILSLAEPANVLEVLMFLPLAILAGGVIAAISGIPTVLISLCLSAPLIPLSKGWPPRHARRFSSICGFFGGCLPVILISLGDPYAWIYAMVPGIVGGLGTRLFVRWIFAAFYRRPASNLDRTLVERSGNNVP